MNKLFGTDGIRGKVGKYPLTKNAVFTIGRALGLWLKQQYPEQKSSLKILIGKDTRESGSELELALLKGVKYEGLKVRRIGICPTPTVAYLTHVLGAHLGVAISASHNPCTDNGIKFFDASGYKLFPLAEKSLEEIFFSLSLEEIDLNLSTEDLREDSKAVALYSEFAKNSLNSLRLAGLRVVIDCAHGSFSKIAPGVFRDLGAEVYAINNQPNGRNINANCGTLHPEMMAEETLQQEANIGIAFDGDGDRIIVADEQGKVLDGDYILAILAQYFTERKELAGNSIICTQMSNIGLELFLERLGIRMIRTKVGDKYVLEEMFKTKTSLGGEQSGHIILLEQTTTGDGLLVALALIKVMLKTKKTLSELSRNLEKFPQVLLNIKVQEKLPLDEISNLNQTIQRYQKELGRSGRLLVRYSGTENLARVMVEGREKSLVNHIANSVARVIKDAVGERG
ncbi:MAG: phosphoglucosamine mutase [Omnitrophica bacterium]|nr:phosphoglucosamine mutase [Candidatus Omnitrophota bacterium]